MHIRKSCLKCHTFICIHYVCMYNHRNAMIARQRIRCSNFTKDIAGNDNSETDSNRQKINASSAGQTRKLEKIEGLLHDFCWKKCACSTCKHTFTHTQGLIWILNIFFVVETAGISASNCTWYNNICIYIFTYTFTETKKPVPWKYIYIYIRILPKNNLLWL